MTFEEAAVVDVVPFVSFVVSPEPSQVGRVRRSLVAFAAEHGAEAGDQRAIALAVSEAMTNAVVHGRDGHGGGRVHVAADVERDVLEIVVADDGPGLSPRRPAPEGLGLGLAFVAAMTTRFEVRDREPRGTEVWMRFVLRRA